MIIDKNSIKSMTTIYQLVMKSLDLAYTNSILIELLNSNDKRTMTSLQNLATSYNTVKKTVYALKDDGLVSIEPSKQGRRTFLVSLTPKGREVAKRSLALAEIASGKSIPKETISVELPQGVHEQIIKILKIDREERSEEEFVLDAVKDKIKKWKFDNPERG